MDLNLEEHSFTNQCLGDPCL